MKLGQFGFLALTVSSLLGCQNAMTTNNQSVGHIAPSKAVYLTPAQTQAAKAKVVYRYVPVAVPGQLMPMNKMENPKGKTPSFLTKAKAVEYANKHAMVTPNSSDFFNAMTTYNFMPGALYTVYTAPMRITDVVFQPGERIISSAAGDTLRWQVNQTYSGMGASKRSHLLIKPNQPGLVNTMIVTTNIRVYHLVLKSTQNGTYMVSVRWQYPHSMVTQGPSDAESTEAAGPSSGSPYDLDLATLNFNYEFGMVKGDKPAWYPTRVFNNGRQTFIEFPKDFYATKTPILYVDNGHDHYSTMVNWRLKGKYMVVDAILHKARLQTGIGKTGQTVVQIQQT